MANKFISVSSDGKYLIASRCEWVYPDGQNRDEDRYNAVGRCDGDIVLCDLSKFGERDRADLIMMLAIYDKKEGD